MIKPALFAGTLAVCCAFGYYSNLVAKELDSKAQQQQAQLEQLRTFKSTYASLKEIEAKWDASFKAAPQDIDLLRLFNLLELSAIAPTIPDSLVVTKVEPEATGLPLTKACLRNIGAGYRINQPSVSKAITSLRSLSSRVDMTYDGVTVASDDKGDIHVDLNEMCVFVRSQA